MENTGIGMCFMNIYEENGNIILRDVKDFHLGQTLECGQCFHFVKIAENDYCISARGRFLHIFQDDKDYSVTLYNTSKADFDNIWRDYFDLDTDYGYIKSEILKRDGKLKEAMDTMWGIRILNQDFFETMISFIISQNQQIPRIKKIVWDISSRHGSRYDVADMDSILGESIGVGYAFPDHERLMQVGEAAIRECKAGFRAPYIIAACDAYSKGELNEDTLRAMNYEEALTTLTRVKGIGDKVANCILLFSLGKRNAFPVDVWIKRCMESIYIGHEADKAYISELAKELFGEYGGYAQQYLFYYGKVNNIGKK